ncbi:NAD(P)H-dependent oxidoreductase [Microbacterium sp. H1-D42]|uniref:NADPH-dependent FMN reductase n=1 Tax=Microbacterium sp. H1-D42 TaxID=2925844 RepID=UPI001F5350CE|nr:NAD(P)H-dependent oxidoreductase [Microbacterium sp. H1-D42]UNK70725.1 NAD(P)H-dependent oxidoreductase [Microbacterium sp. H1-D42]
MSSTPRISVIVGSARPVRIGRQLADSVASTLSTNLDAEIQILDLAEVALPMLDEPLMAGMNQYQNAHTVAWANLIAESDGVIFVTPQYNAGYPAALKNAIDYIYAEWKNKPSAIISYGGRGGLASAAQLRQVLEFIGLDLVDTDASFTIAQTDYTPEWSLGDSDAVVARYADDVRALGDAVLAKIDAEEEAEAA